MGGDDAARTSLRRKVRADGRCGSAPDPPAALLFRMDTGHAVQAEVDSLRAQCRAADLAIERYQRVHDEYLYAQEEADAVRIASSNIESFEDALEELASIHLAEQVPAALGFADRTILAEMASTRANLEDCIGQCRATMRRMTEVLTRSQADPEKGDRDRGQGGAGGETVSAADANTRRGEPDAADPLGSLAQMLQLSGEQRWIKR